MEAKKRQKALRQNPTEEMQNVSVEEKPEREKSEDRRLPWQQAVL